jgi:hypothetical protein
MTNDASLANHEVVTIAVFLLRGDIQLVETEDVAVKAAEVAPGRFSWRKYPEQINFESVRRRLTTAADDYGYVIGSQRDGWRLTDKGREFAEAAAERLEVAEQRRPLSLREKQWRSRERERMLSSHAYSAFTKGDNSSFTVEDAERFFRIDEHVSAQQRKARVERALVFFSDDDELGALVAAMAALLSGRNRDDQ